MKALTRAVQSIRKTVLAKENRRRLRRDLRGLLRQESTPIFFIFTPDIVHFAPYCIPKEARGFEPVLILNSVSAPDERWLREIHPNRLIISLKVSLTKNPESILAHGTVLDDIFATVKKSFCIQDPDCFVTDSSFWSRVKLDFDKDLAAGPFTKRPTDHDHVLPDTFFLMFNTKVFESICDQYEISAASYSELKPAAQNKIQELGYHLGQYPEQFKAYFDTLQAFWLLALAHGYRFNEIPGAGESIFHIGGTSYLHSSDYDLAHWDYWPLSVIYFNLRLLEAPEAERFRARFVHLFEQYKSSKNLLKTFPEFAINWRYKQLQLVLSHILKDASISAGE